MRITQSGRDLPVVERGEQITIYVDEQPIEAYLGETIAAAMIAAGIRQFRHTKKNGDPRGIYCGMGVCYECLVNVDGTHNVRACMTPVADGMKVDTRSEITLLPEE
jgi:predicted molibdopterin-dependent oxidoreductase YjgC